MLKKIISLVIITLLLGSCQETTESKIIKEERKLNEFSDIIIDVCADIEFIESLDYKLQIEVREDRLDQIAINDSSNQLRLNYQGKLFENNYKVKIKIYGHNIQQLTLNKASFISGDIVNDQFTLILNQASRADLKVKAETVNLQVNEASNVSLDLKAKDLVLQANNASFTKFKGTVDSIDFQAAEASVVEANNLITQTAILKATQAANIQIKVKDRALATASEASLIQITTAQAKIEKNISTLGQVEVLEE